MDYEKVKNAFQDIDTLICSMLEDIPLSKRSKWVKNICKLANKHGEVCDNQLFLSKNRLVDANKVMVNPLKRKDEQDGVMEVLRKSVNMNPIVTGIIPALDSNIDELSLEECYNHLQTMYDSLNAENKKILSIAATSWKFIFKIRDSVNDDSKFLAHIKTLNILWSQSYVYFLISFYKFTLVHKKFLNCTVSVHYFWKNFKLIKDVLANNLEQYNFWKNID